MDFFKVISCEETKKLLNERFADKRQIIKTCSVEGSLGYTAAEDIFAAAAVPSFNRSTVDGFAVRSADCFGASESLPALLQNLGKVLMGEAATLSVNAGTAVAVPTGGMLPKGSDGVVMIENCEDFGDHTVGIRKPIAPGENTITAGDDLQVGELVLQKGQKITPLLVGLLSAAGVTEVKCFNRPRFYIISTGDELVNAGESLSGARIYNVNGPVLAASIRNRGGEVVKQVIIKDQYQLLLAAVKEGIEQADCVLVSGGSSVGERDYTYKVINELSDGGAFIKGIAIKPGKPTIVGKAGNAALVGLPGHPVSAAMIYKALIEPLFFSEKHLQEAVVKAKMAVNMPSSPGKTTFQPVNLQNHDGEYFASPVFGKSGLISLLAKSSGYIEIKDNYEGLYQNDEVEVHLW